MGNKRGQYILSIGGLMFFFIAVIFITTGLAVQNNPQASLTVSGLDWNKDYASKFQTVPSNETAGIVKNIAFAAVNCVGYTVFEIAKAGMNIAINHPEINFKLFLIIFIVWMLIPLVIELIKGLAIFFILIKEAVVSYNERKKLKQLKEKQNVREQPEYKESVPGTN